jgi:hypothetical protein
MHLIQEINIMTMPIVQYASYGVRMNFMNGRIITSLIPVVVRPLLMATMIEMTRIVDGNSVRAKIKLLNTELIDPLKEPVASRAILKIPNIQMMVVSFRKTINRVINPIKTK